MVLMSYQIRVARRSILDFTLNAIYVAMFQEKCPLVQKVLTEYRLAITCHQQIVIEHVTLVVITGITILVPNLKVSMMNAAHLKIEDPEMKSTSPRSSVVPFHNDFSPSGEQPEQRKSAHTLYYKYLWNIALQPTAGCDNQLSVVEQYFTNIAAIQNMRLLWQIWLKNLWGIPLVCQIPQCGYMEHGLKYIAF